MSEQKTPLDECIRLVSEALPGVSAKPDVFLNTEGQEFWFTDFEFEGHGAVAQYHPSFGFGISSSEEYGFTHKPDLAFETLEELVQKIIELMRTKTRTS